VKENNCVVISFWPSVNYTKYLIYLDKFTGSLKSRGCVDLTKNLNKSPKTYREAIRIAKTIFVLKEPYKYHFRTGTKCFRIKDINIKELVDAGVLNKDDETILRR